MAREVLWLIQNQNYDGVWSGDKHASQTSALALVENCSQCLLPEDICRKLICLKSPRMANLNI